MEQSSLVKRGLTSTTYNLLGNSIQLLVHLARAILLARMLPPEIFGIYALASSYVMLTRTLPLFGLSNAFIHRAPESSGEMANRVHFTLSLGFNLVWIVTLLAIGNFALHGQLYVLAVILLSKVVDNLVATGRLILVKQVAFQRIATLDTISVIFASGAAIYLAWRGAGVWSLLITDIFTSAIGVLGYYLIRPVWRPSFGFAPTVVRYFLNFGRRSLIADILGQSLDHLDDFWTGTNLGEIALGFYSRAYTFATYPRKILAVPLNSLSLSIYAELKDQPRKLSQAFFRVNAFLIRSGFLLGGILALVAPEFIRLVIGSKWLPMLNPFRLMLLYTLLDPVSLTIANLFSAIGVPEWVTRIRVFQFAILVIGLFLAGPLYGITGVALAVDAMLIVGIVLLLRESRKFISFSMRKLFMAPTLALIFGSAFARIALLIPGLPSADLRTLFIKSIIFTSVFSLTLFLLEKEHLPMMLDMAKKVLPTPFFTQKS